MQGIIPQVCHKSFQNKNQGESYWQRKKQCIITYVCHNIFHQKKMEKLQDNKNDEDDGSDYETDEHGNTS